MICSLLLLCLLGQAADLDYQRGMALAREQRWEEAEAAFREGARRAPADKRFPLELAGIAFKRRDYGSALRNVHRALKIDPADAYANEFAGTVYLLEGNTEAALKYWNRIAKPRIENFRTEPAPRVDPVLLDRAFAFAPASTVTLTEYRATLARLGHLDLFPSWTLTLEPRPDSDSFDAVLRTVQTRWWLNALRGLPYWTLYPGARNLGGRGIGIQSLLRWDTQKRRAALAITGPIARQPAWLYRVFADARNENWIIPGRDGFNLKRTAAGAETEALFGDRWKWTSGARFTHRRFANAGFTPGSTLEAHTGLSAALLRIPERKLSITGGGDARMGRFFEQGVFTKTEASAEAKWHETNVRFRAGRSSGPVPFDEFYMLGYERDNNLWMRAHIGTSDGKKGSAPLGSGYLLANWETDKVVREGGFYTFSLGPFLDTGKVYGRPGTQFGYSGWMFDTGIQLKVRVRHAAEIVVLWGKDLRTGRNAWYATAR
ncbi:MAG: tetratricopeptide repeat protein [Acidobacteriota bacterium]